MGKVLRVHRDRPDQKALQEFLGQTVRMAGTGSTAMMVQTDSMGLMEPMAKMVLWALRALQVNKDRWVLKVRPAKRVSPEVMASMELMLSLSRSGLPSLVQVVAPVRLTDAPSLNRTPRSTARRLSPVQNRQNGRRGKA